jgi:hypothetical protein
LSFPYRQANPGPGANPADHFYLKLYKHTGALILWQQRSYTVTGTLQECGAAYRDAQTYNLLAGWWTFCRSWC